MDKLIAVTGGIASGKSTVCSFLKEMGYIVFSADETYSQLLKNEEFSTDISILTNTALIEENGIKTIDRKAVSEVVFQNKEILKKLNGFTHDKIMKTMIEKSRKENGVVFNEVPLLFENGYEKLYDGVIVVMRDEANRLKSAIMRDNISESEVRKRMENQYNYIDSKLIAYTLLYNDGDIKSLKYKVKDAVSKIIDF